uniref:Protein kinase domain-containing protein n=1 Tax=Oryza rufipogon TaxID=4529 RepID=A0A0E0NBL5_ORYRU
MNPKISDFGLARRYSPGVDEEYADRILGSIGFIAPECRERRLFSTKSDVYGFGALVLEIISGKRCFSLASGDSGDDYGFLNKRGQLHDGLEVAVKRCFELPSSRNQMDFQDLEFQNEICSLGKLQHINVVKLLGYCIQGTERILVYDGWTGNRPLHMRDIRVTVESNGTFVINFKGVRGSPMVQDCRELLYRSTPRIWAARMVFLCWRGHRLVLQAWPLQGVPAPSAGPSCPCSQGTTMTVAAIVVPTLCKAVNIQRTVRHRCECQTGSPCDHPPASSTSSLKATLCRRTVLSSIFFVIEVHCIGDIRSWEWRDETVY